MGCNQVFDRILPGQPNHQVNSLDQPGQIEFFLQPDPVPALDQLDTRLTC
jgi:hypothetical protein